MSLHSSSKRQKLEGRDGQPRNQEEDTSNFQGDVGSHVKANIMHDTANPVVSAKTSEALRRAVTLNFDILDLICQFLLPPPEYLDSALTAGPNSLWMRVLRMKKSLTLVCRLWRQAALPFLYQDIPIRRIGQLFALRRTLQSSPETAYFIKSISLTFILPREQVTPTSRCASAVLKLCTRLKCLKFTSGFLRPFLLHGASNNNWDCQMFLDTLTEIAPGIMELHSLDLLSSPTYAYEYPWLSKSPLKFGSHTFSLPFLWKFRNVRCLSLTVAPQCNWNFNAAPLSFEHLEELFLCLEELDRTHEHLQTFSTWHFPSLRRVGFAFVSLESCPFEMGEEQGLERFFKAHGHRIRELDFGQTPMYYAIGSALESDARWCGCTEDIDNHILAIIRRSLDMSPHVKYISLRALDEDGRSEFHSVITSWDSSIHVDVWGEAADLPSTPEHPLRPNIRVVDKAFLSTPDIARAFPPPAISGNTEPVLHHLYREVRLVETPFALFRPDWEGDWPAPLRAHMQLETWEPLVPDVDSETRWATYAHATIDDSPIEEDEDQPEDSADITPPSTEQEYVDIHSALVANPVGCVVYPHFTYRDEHTADGDFSTSYSDSDEE
ncbi:hypothetical protein EIP91_003598 [Steccherinum ochraceum]|uniref:F-box domain-containing protein n=1 Tax=Steccherinum ochraceum TaxID=92696 RepID=A0A4V2MW43_9APHY|nr:hypothetical protein EIP91_003598 [Steccherinum ochraceum]